MANTSGIYPSGDRILIKVDEIKKAEGSLIEIPETLIDKREGSQVLGELVAVGPDCWTHYVQRTSSGDTVTSGYSGPFAKVGDRVMFAKYGGLDVKGLDGQSYRIMRDEDITAIVDKNLKMVDVELDIRTPVAKKGKK